MGSRRCTGRGRSSGSRGRGRGSRRRARAASSCAISARGWRWAPAIRGASQGSSCRRPTCQKRRAIAVRSASGSPRNQPRARRVSASSSSTNDQSDSVNAGVSWRKTRSTRSAPASASSAAHSNALWRPPTISTRRPARPAKSTVLTVWDHCSGASRSVTSAGSTAKKAIPGAATARSAWIVDPSSRWATRSSVRVCTRPGSGVRPSCSANQSAYAMNVSTGIGSSSHPPTNASNVCTPAASRCHSRPDRSSIPSGMLRRQNRIGSPTTVTDSPRRRASAATARPYGPAPMTSSSM